MLGNNLICTGVKMEDSIKYLYYTSLHVRARKERLCLSVPEKMVVSLFPLFDLKLY